jgi:hypothetical protein
MLGASAFLATVLPAARGEHHGGKVVTNTFHPGELCPPPDARLPGETRPPDAPGTAGTVPADAFAQAPEAGTQTAATFNPTMLGDQLGIPGLAFLPFRSLGLGAPVLVPSVRSFKIAENESARPQDRVYAMFNYYNDVNRSVNERLGAPIRNVEVYRENFGLEKTFLDGDASIGFRLPVNTLSRESGTILGGISSELGGTDTAVGDLTIISKFALLQNLETGNVFTTGLAVTIPTGPDDFAGTGFFTYIHSTNLQPYVGYLLNFGRLYVHGFSSIDIPTDSRDVTVWHNDLGVGYFLVRRDDPSLLITAVVPTFEAHVTNPLNHRGAFDLSDPSGTPDWVDLTSGLVFEFRKRSALSIGFVTPVTGPRPYDFEVLAQFNWRFGRSAPYAGFMAGY